MIKEKDKLFSLLEMWLVAGWKETSISSDLWVESLKNKEIGFQNNCPCLEMCRGIGKLNFTYSCLSGLRPEHRTGAFLILKNWPSAPCPNIEKFSFDSGETFLIGQSKIPQNRQASKVPGGGGGASLAPLSRSRAQPSPPSALSLFSLPSLRWPLKVLGCLGQVI